MKASGIFLSVLSGLLLTAGFPSTDLFYLSWIALVPLFWALRGQGPKKALLLGLVCGLVHYATTLYWIRYVLYYYGGLPLPVALLALLLLCSYLALYPAVFAMVTSWWSSRPALWAFGLPFVWVALEWVRAHALTGFPWANLGYTQTLFTPLTQIADVTGVFGVSWLIVFANTSVSAWLNGWRVRMACLAALLLCVGGTLTYGFLRLDTVRDLQANARPWTVGVAQGNVDQSKKWDPAFQQETLKRYRELSLKAAASNPAPDLIVWPETAAPFFYGIEDELTAQLNGIIREAGVPVLFGSPAMTHIDGQVRLLNRAYLVDSRGVIAGAYAKQHLVPFGEYVPLKDYLFFIKKLVEQAGDFVAGDDSSPLSLGGRLFGVLICYEGIFPDLSRQTVLRGANALVVITNDAWYGPTSAPYQHLDLARWRSIEFRVPMIRAANTGVSAAFDAVGATLATIPLNEMGEFAVTVHPLNVQTIYAKWGDFFAWICVLVAVGGTIYRARERRTTQA
ncbi:MAG: apolipoprotein N-acyltransferase [Acidobacteriota bacterium]